MQHTQSTQTQTQTYARNTATVHKRNTVPKRKEARLKEVLTCCNLMKHCKLVVNRRKRRKTSSEKLLDTIIKRTEDRTQMFKNIESAMEEPQKHHTIKLFFDSMAEKVIRFPPDLAACTKINVLREITNLKFENFESAPQAEVLMHQTIPIQLTQHLLQINSLNMKTGLL